MNLKWCFISHISSRSLEKPQEHYEGKGQLTVAYLIGELFFSILFNESDIVSQINIMQQKVYLLSSLGQHLNDSLIAIAIIISLPPSYLTLRTIIFLSFLLVFFHLQMRTNLADTCTCLILTFHFRFILGY